MSNELRLHYTTAMTVVARLKTQAGLVFYPTGGAAEAFGTAGRVAANYNVAVAEISDSYYSANAPANLPAGTWEISYWDSTITDTPIGQQTLQWDGTAEVDPITAYLGGGDHEVTLTIRTTAGAVMPGVRVWLSTDGDRENALTAARTTDDAGHVVFYCDYATTYYIHCHKTGYTFASANFTPAAGSVAFTKDIGTVYIASGASSDYEKSFLVRAIDWIRLWTAEPSIKAKYSDTRLIERLEVNYALALGEINRMMGDVLVNRFAITLTGAGKYVLPATFGPVQAIYYDGGYGYKIFWTRNSSLNPNGKGVWVEGNVLRYQDSAFEIGDTVTVEAWPTGLARLHCGTCTVDATGTIVTLGATPYLGQLDTQINAYVGSSLRIFNVTGTSPTGPYIQERPITAYAVATRQATLDVALDPIPAAGSGGYIFYEIAPQIPIGFDSVLAAKTAWEINSAEGQKAKAAGALNIYQTNIRHLRLTAWMRQMQDAGVAESDSFMNSRFGGNAF
jgi:hypothetical protein